MSLATPHSARHDAPVPEVLAEFRGCEPSPIFGIDGVRSSITDEMRQAIIRHENESVPFATVEILRRSAENMLRDLRTQVRTALPIEEPDLNHKINELAGAYAPIARLKEKLHNVNSIFDRVLRDFPKAEVLDLTVLSSYFLESGLPRFTLVNPFLASTDRHNWLIVSCEEAREGFRVRSALDGKDQTQVGLDREISDEIGLRVAAACNCFPKVFGTRVYYPPKASQYGPALQLSKQMGIAPTDADTPAHFVESIDLKPQLKLDLIPDEMRQIIKKASESKLFDAVVLLVEVNSWEVVHSGLPIPSQATGTTTWAGNPKDDPLILGVKSINGSNVAFLLEAFNTTSWERYAQSEWTSAVGQNRAAYE